MLVGDGWAFVHVPKCGGTTVRSVLREHEVSEVLPLQDEATVSHRFHWVARARPPGRVFCFVRHPAAWLRSYWCMRVTEGRRDPRKVLDALWSSDLDAWALRVCEERPGYVGRLFEAYTACCTEVYRLELGVGPVLSSVIRRYIRVPQLNRGRPATFAPATLAAIAHSERAAIKRYYA